MDQTGVGRPTIELLADGLRNRVTCTLWRVSITLGNAVNWGEPSSIHVPKQELVNTLQVLLRRRLAARCTRAA